ncbi:MAG TPA: hypothetical protein VE978_24510 [Chitinophagales bacterium]|nr:hypothetical protein [Chitinophagales bacterium]
MTKEIAEVLRTPNIADNLTKEIQNLAKARTSTKTNPPGINLEEAIQSLDRIIGIIAQIKIGQVTPNKDEIIEKLRIGNLVDKRGVEHFTAIKSELENAPVAQKAIIINNTIAELNDLRNIPKQLLNLLQPFITSEKVKFLNENEGIIEIVFDGKVRIEDFGEAKEQMNEWFIIIDGYAKLLGVRREDFEIISISKNSPASFKIKTALTNAMLVLTIVSSLVAIEKTVLEDKLLIEKLKQNSLIPDTELQSKFIDTAMLHIDNKVKAGIEEIANQKIIEHKIDEGNGDIKVNLSKGIQYQYNFIVNGGTVNFQITNGQVQQQVDSLEKTKVALKQIRENYENQKAINEKTDSTAEQ